MENLKSTMDAMVKSIEQTKKQAMDKITDKTQREEIAKLFSEAEDAIKNPTKYDLNKMGNDLAQRAKMILKVTIIIILLNFTSANAQDSCKVVQKEKPQTEQKHKTSTFEAVVTSICLSFALVLTIAALSIKTK